MIDAIEMLMPMPQNSEEFPSVFNNQKEALITQSSRKPVSPLISYNEVGHMMKNKT